MPTQTLLDMTQEILSHLSSDEVNSISDTTESLQVATIIKRKYFDIVARASLPEHTQLIQLTPSNDDTMPVLMTVPDEVNSIEWIKYFDSNVLDNATEQGFHHSLNVDIQNNANNIPNSPPGYLYVTILPLRQFLDRMTNMNPNDSNIDSFLFTDSSNSFPGNYTIYYRNDMQPRYCTVISNLYVIFDSFDNTQDSTLQSSKTMCFGQVAPAFRMEDDFIPRIDDKQFPLLINESLAWAFYELKQTPHAKAEQEIKRQWSTVQKRKSVDNKPTYFDQLPNYGRNFGLRYGFRKSPLSGPSNCP